MQCAQLSPDFLLTPVAQYGFAGICVVILLWNFWLTRRLIDLLQRVTKALTENTDVIKCVKRDQQETAKNVRDVRDLLLSRPYIGRSEAVSR